MQYRTWFAALPLLMLMLTACASDPGDTAKLTLKNTTWDRINVQVVITKGSDCDNRGSEFIGQQEFVMIKDRSQTITAPNGASICWRHDRNPTNPTPGAWSGWSRAILFPGESTETQL